MDNNNNIICSNCKNTFVKAQNIRHCSNCFACFGCEMYACPYCGEVTIVVSPEDARKKQSKK